MSEQVNINERVSVRHSDIPRVVILVLLPVECFGVGLFLFYLAFHWRDFIGQSASIIAWLGWFTGLVLYVGLAWLAVKVIRAGLETVIAFSHGIADVHQKFILNRQARARQELLYTADNYVVFLDGGKITVQSVIQERYNYSIRQGQLAGPDTEMQALPPGNQLPTNVLYEDIRHKVPQGHILVGIGRQGIETKERAVGACVWIVGLSGTGKTSTTTLRVEERAADKHAFLGVDPHWFKDDSLYHAIYETLDGEPGPYANCFIAPMAKTPEESLEALKMFLSEFNLRKSGQRPKPWRRITLLVDEVGAMMDKATATKPEEKEIIELLPSIARICGQEARNFEMGGIFISQQATGLAWLRKVALMVIVHQLLQESEKKLATNEDVEVMKDMKTWPIGRTYVYGVGFQDGPRTVQQPYFSAPDGSTDQWNNQDMIEGTIEPATSSETNTGELPIDEDLREALEAWRNGATGPRSMQRMLGCTYYQAQKFCAELVEKGLVETD